MDPHTHEGSQLFDSLRELLRAGRLDDARTLTAELPASEVPWVLTHLSAAERSQLLPGLDPELAASLLEHLAEAQSADIIEELSPQVAAEILWRLPSNERADVLAELEDDAATAVLDGMAPQQAENVQRLSKYPELSAGGLMITEYLSFDDGCSVGDVVDDLRANTEAYRRHNIQYIYITDAAGRLEGVLRLRDLVLTEQSTPVRDIMITDTNSVRVDADVGDLEDFFDTHPYLGVPVVDEGGILIGVVRHADVAEAIGEYAASAMLKAQGIVGGEELRTMPALSRARRRLSWLSANIVLNILAASIIAAYQETLAAAIVLAVFLPIISDMSGCSGNQAIAVSMRELSLNLVRPEDAMRVWGQEIKVGFINATALGVLLALAAYLWQGNLELSLVVGSALALNTLVSVSLGGLVPLFLRGMNMDPALASGPILTTVTDMCGFFLVLSLASVVLL